MINGQAETPAGETKSEITGCARTGVSVERQNCNRLESSSIDCCDDKPAPSAWRCRYLGLSGTGPADGDLRYRSTRHGERSGPLYAFPFMFTAKGPATALGIMHFAICHQSKRDDRRPYRRYAKRRPGRRRQVHSRLQRWPTSARRSNIPTLAAMHRHSWCGVSNSSKICVLSLRGAAANLYQSLPISLGIASSPHRLPRDDSLAEP